MEPSALFGDIKLTPRAQEAFGMKPEQPETPADLNDVATVIGSDGVFTGGGVDIAGSAQLSQDSFKPFHKPNQPPSSVGGGKGILSKIDEALAPSEIYQGIKSAVTAPSRAYKGEIDSFNYPEQAMAEAVNLAGNVGVSGMVVPRPAGSLGIFGRADLSGLSKDTKDQITAMQNAISRDPTKFKDRFVHDAATGRNYFVDPRGELIVEYPDVVGTRAIGWEDRHSTGSLYEKEIPHPDPTAKELLSETGLFVNSYNKETFFREGDGWSTDSIHIKPSHDRDIAYYKSAEYNAIRKEFEDLRPGDPKFNEKFDQITKKQDELYTRVSELKKRKETLSNAFNISYVAHEGAHKAQKASDLPRGGNPITEVRKIFEETISNDPQKLAEYDYAVKLANDWLAQHPLQLMVAITQLKPNSSTYKKYIDMLYVSPEDAGTNKLFEKVELKDNDGNVTSVSFKPDKKAILNEVLKDIYIGKLDASGTNFEPWAKMSVDAFRAYKNKYGEVYARVAQKRAFEAASGKDPNVYKKNPQAYLDVDPKDITFDNKGGGELSMMTSSHGAKGNWKIPDLSEMKKYKGKNEQGFGFYTTESTTVAAGHGSGTVKQFDIPDELLPDLLNRTTSMMNQSDHVYNSLVKEASRSVDSRLSDFDPFHKAMERMALKGADKITGGQFYNMLVEGYTKHLPGKDSGEKLFNAKVAASERLDRAGIKGAMYLSPKGARNTVLWNQELLTSMKYEDTTPELDGMYISDRGLIGKPK